MRYVIYIILAIIITSSCRGREAAALRHEVHHLKKERDSLQILLRITRDYFYNMKTDENDTLCYYVTGSVNKLMAKGIIQRVRGLSRDFHPGHNHSHTDFHSAVKSSLDTIHVRGKIPRIIGCFNPEHYSIVSENNGTSHYFIITDKSRFWRFSSFLIIAYR